MHQKNYLTIVPGVAIATAVIPPLSVAGFGIGIGNFKILFGGMFLFFTNFVAIIIATCIIFYIYGFRPTTDTKEDISALKKRLSALAGVLFVISIPLVYTLHRSIVEVGLRNNIQSSLKQSFDKERYSRLLTFNYSKNKDGKLEINAVVNTINYIKELEANDIEKILKERLKKDLKLYLEQVKVQPGGLKEEVVKATAPTIAPPKPPQEIIRSSRESILTTVRQSTTKIENIISPSTIVDFYVGFHDKIYEVSIILKIKRDQQLSDEEITWLKRIFSTELNLPVMLSVEHIPFVPSLVFQKGETSLSDEMKKAIITIKEIYARDTTVNIIVEAYTGSAVSSKKGTALAKERIKNIEMVLNKECTIPDDKIKTAIYKSKKTEAPAVKITISIAG